VPRLPRPLVLPRHHGPLTPSRRRRPLTLAALLSILLLLGCAGESGEEPAQTAEDSESPAESEVPIPDTPLGEQIAWVLDTLAADSGPDEDTAAERFTEEFITEAGDLESVFDGLRAAGPYVLDSLENHGTAAQVRLTDGHEQPIMMEIALDDAEQIAGLLFTPDQVRERDSAQSWEELETEMEELADTVVLESYPVEQGECLGPDHEPAPSGSMFKLFVLAVVAEEVLDGDLSWDDPLTVTEELRSLPSGELQDAAEGTEVTVADAASGMIAISDNTATDMLIDAVGRETIEAALPELGVSDPELLMPFLTTRELFLLGWGAPQVREQWADAGTDTRRELLTELPDDLEAVDPAAITEPVWTDGVDWMVPAQDLCAVHAHLQQLGGEVREILAQNPGLEVDQAAWDYAGFKGGSAPGVIAGSWYLEDAVGEPVVLVIQLADPAQHLDPGLFAALAQDAADLLAAG